MPEKLKVLIEALERFAPHDPFIEHNLFEPPRDWPTISLHKQQMIDFRNNYRLLGEFAAEVCGVPLGIFCKVDMIDYLNRRAGEGK
jgi:hypothetical protein